MIVIPMAGLSRRFSDAGYTRPKYRLELHGSSLFALAVLSFRAYFETEPFLIIARAEAGIEDFVAGELATLGLRSARTVILDNPTRGQAETVQLGLLQAGVDTGMPLTIFNIDTFRPGFKYPDAPWMGQADGYLEVMRGSDPGYSYVLPAVGDSDRVARTAEKEVISNLASTGLYWFRRVSDFLDAMGPDGDPALSHGELYVAPLYNRLIVAGRDIRYHQVAASDVVFCGIPAQYEALLGPTPGH